MLPDWVSNPGPLTYESGALPIALRGPAKYESVEIVCCLQCQTNSVFCSCYLCICAENMCSTLVFRNKYSVLF